MELQQKDEMEKKWAESESNCGRAIRDVSGKWIPVDPVIVEDFEPTQISEGVLENV